ncbi:hypothetical protein ACHAXS_007715 [Conticribra weissflogii]
MQSPKQLDGTNNTTNNYCCLPEGHRNNNHTYLMHHTEKLRKRPGHGHGQQAVATTGRRTEHTATGGRSSFLRSSGINSGGGSGNITHGEGIDSMGGPGSANSVPSPTTKSNPNMNANGKPISGPSSCNSVGGGSNSGGSQQRGSQHETLANNHHSRSGRAANHTSGLRRSKQKTDSAAMAHDGSSLVTMSGIRDEEAGRDYDCCYDYDDDGDSANTDSTRNSYELTSLLLSATAISHGHDDHSSIASSKSGNHSHNIPQHQKQKHHHNQKHKHKHKQRSSEIDYHDDKIHDDADDTKTNPENDIRSRKLFLQTAFWLCCWYGTSLATLFLNKIILSRPNSSVHVLGMCQMTAAALLGGWSAYGGVDWVVGVMERLAALSGKCFNRCVSGGSGTGSKTRSSASRAARAAGNHVTAQKPDDHHHQRQFLAKDHSSNLDIPSKSNNSTSLLQHNLSQKQPNQNPQQQNQQQNKPTHHQTQTHQQPLSYSFIRDMSIVGILRGLTVVLGLIALEHVPVSFVETIKATAPAFTVIFARLILQERTSTPVALTLVPVVAGLVLCSASELRFDTVGFIAAVLNNCADCVQNVMSKRMLARLKPTQLQFYTSVAALVLQCPWLLRDVSGWVRDWWVYHRYDHDGGFGDVDNLEGALSVGDAEDYDDPSVTSSSSSWSTGQLLLLDAIFYHLQSVSAYCTMGCMSPVSQSVANTLKRALLVWASILYFGNPVTSSGVLGMVLVVLGVFLYNHMRRLYQS